MYNVSETHGTSKNLEVVMEEKTFSLDELCQLVGLDKRTIRFYIQMELVPRPVGETRAARYNRTHLACLLQIKNWRNEGVSLERIGELLKSTESTNITPTKHRKNGEVEVRSHITVCPGVEIQISPTDSNLSPEQLRELVRQVAVLAENLNNFNKEKKE
jgi:DNA-binding transcriptional MerR regulator